MITKGASHMLGKRSVVAATALAAIAIALGGTGATRTDAEDTPTWRGQWVTEAELAIEPRTGAAVAVDPYRPHRVVPWGGVARDGRLLNDGIVVDRLWVVATDPEMGRAKVASLHAGRWGNAVDVPLPVARALTSSAAVSGTRPR